MDPILRAPAPHVPPARAGERAGDRAATTTDSPRIERAARLRFAVARALARGTIDFAFQPVVRADRPDFPAFHEMLVRMRDERGEQIPAARFMPLIESGPLGRAVDQLALHRAVALLEERPALRLSINMSPLSMSDEGWLTAFERLAGRSPQALSRLILEITETEAIRDVALTRDFMACARETGIAFALDDFGAGATGFRHFRELRFDMVKIDGGFVQGISRTPDAQVLVRCLQAVAQHFEMMTVAERVEDPADAAWLAELGIDCMQGYLYGRPGAEPTGACAPERGRAAG